MSKILVCLAALFLMTAGTKAQSTKETVLLGVGLQGLAPMGNWSDAYYIGFGLGVMGEFFMSDNFSLNPEYFFKSYPGREIEIDGERRETTALPYHNISVGARVYLLPILYLGAGVGCFFNGDTGDGDIGFTPAAGIKLDRLDGQIHATYAGEYRYVGLRISVYFLGW